MYFFFIWLYSLILGRFHRTLRFISVNRSRTVGRTPWTGDQLVAGPLLTARGDCDDDREFGGMNGFLAGDTEVLGENLSRRQFVHHKSHLRDPDANSYECIYHTNELQIWNISSRGAPELYIQSEVWSVYFYIAHSWVRFPPSPRDEGKTLILSSVIGLYIASNGTAKWSWMENG
jgi:hypothetical protein